MKLGASKGGIHNRRREAELRSTRLDTKKSVGFKYSRHGNVLAAPKDRVRGDDDEIARRKHMLRSGVANVNHKRPKPSMPKTPWDDKEDTT